MTFKGRSSLAYAERYVDILRNILLNAPNEAEGVQGIATWLANLPTPDLIQFYVNMHMLSHVVITSSEIVQGILMSRGMGEHVASRVRSEEEANLEVIMAGSGSFEILDPARHPDDLTDDDGDGDMFVGVHNAG